MKRASIVLATVVFTSLLATAPAHATYPGFNGRITFGRFTPEVGDDEIWAVDPDGGNDVQLTNVVSEFSDWSPDGRRIAFDFQDAAGQIQIATMKTDGSGVVQLTHDESVYHALPTFSPDGTRIAYEHDARDVSPSRPDGIYLMDASNGHHDIRLTSNPYGLSDEDPSFSPDGRQIVFQRHRIGSGVSGNQSALFVIGVDGSGLNRITSWGSEAGQPDWSPSGDWIAFNTSSDHFTASRQIFVVHPDGSGTRQITFGTNGGVSYQPSWSPDGSAIVFARVTSDLGRVAESLWTMHADGSSMTPIPGTTDCENPDWGPAA